VRLVVRAGGEEELVRRAVRARVADGDRPQAVDHELLAGIVAERAAVREPLVGLGIRIDLTVAEVADEQITREAPE
jgi:hypothetical protein